MQRNNALLVYYDCFEMIENALGSDDAAFALAVKAIMHYAQNGEILPDLETKSPLAAFAVKMMMPKINATLHAMTELSSKRSENGRKGGQARRSKAKQNEANEANEANASKSSIQSNPIQSNTESSLFSREREDSVISPLNPPEGDLAGEAVRYASHSALPPKENAIESGQAGFLGLEEKQETQTQMADVERYWASVIHCSETELSDADRDTLCEFVADYGKDSVIRAIRQTNSVAQEKHCLQYVRGVLRGEKMRAEEQVRKEEKAMASPRKLPDNVILINGIEMHLPKNLPKVRKGEIHAAVGSSSE